MCNICDYCDENGRVIPFVGEAYVCPKCNGTKIPIVAAETIGMDIPMPQDAGVGVPYTPMPRGEILTPEQLQERLQRSGLAAAMRRSNAQFYPETKHWVQAPAADANAQPKFEIRDETSIINGVFISGSTEGFLAGINWAKGDGKVYADAETQSPFDERQSEDRVHRVGHSGNFRIPHGVGPAVWYDSALGEALPQSEVDFEKSLKGDIWVHIFQNGPGAEREHLKILRPVRDAIEAGTVSTDIGYHIAKLPLSQQAAALEMGLCGQYPEIVVRLPSVRMGKSNEWRKYRDNFLAQWQGAEAGQNYTDAVAYAAATMPRTRDEKTQMFGAMYGAVSSQERHFQAAMADAPTLGEIIGLLRVTEGRLKLDAEYFLAACGGNEDQTKMLGKVRRARVKLQNLEKCMLGRVHHNERMAALMKPKSDIVPKYDVDEVMRRYDLDAKNMQNLRQMNDQAKDKTNVDPMSVEITMQYDLPERGDLSEMKPVMVDIKVDDESVMNALKMKRQITEQLRKGMVLDGSDIGRVIREKDELDEEHAKGTGPMPPKELL